MPQRTIKSVYFEYRTDQGTYVTARKGQTVEIPEGEYLDRGDRHGAFVATAAEEVAVANEVAGIVTPTETETPPSAPVAPAVVVVPDEELAKVLEGNVGEVVAYAEAHPDEAQAVLEAEKAKAEPRKGVVEGLSKLIEG